ncbi:helix-turn-helix domain-containing protein [Sphingopyxis sp. J-6]|uniref:AraC family transcriptional regulator n=1 Tax=Sphingopyxis sp. J-6 TaxID=3122054 RepID=UPI00398423E2
MSALPQIAEIVRHGARERLPRHRHARAYVALVLGGGYEEAGDQGRVAAAAGTVVIHGDWTAHRDLFGLRGARVLNLPMAPDMVPGAGHIDDPDAAARLAERDAAAAADYVRDHFRPGAALQRDWPDLLAAALADDPDIALAGWADGVGLDPASVSRGFMRAYGVTPKRFRLEARTRRALLALAGWRGSLAALAADQGFADQAHLARSVAAMTGMPPVRFRAKSVQA